MKSNNELFYIDSYEILTEESAKSNYKKINFKTSRQKLNWNIQSWPYL